MRFDDVYLQMISLVNVKWKKDLYDRIFFKFIRDHFGFMNICDFKLNDIDYFYICLKHKTYSDGKFYSEKYINEIMRLLKKIILFCLDKGFINFKEKEIVLYFSKIVCLY